MSLYQRTESLPNFDTEDDLTLQLDELSVREDIVLSEADRLVRTGTKHDINAAEMLGPIISAVVRANQSFHNVVTVIINEDDEDQEKWIKTICSSSKEKRVKHFNSLLPLLGAPTIPDQLAKKDANIAEDLASLEDPAQKLADGYSFDAQADIDKLFQAVKGVKTKSEKHSFIEKLGGQILDKGTTVAVAMFYIGALVYDRIEDLF